MISKFRGDYYFLSNMYPCDINIEGYIFKSAESLFQALRACTDEDFKKFCGMNGYDAKRLGDGIVSRADWDDIKLDAMRFAVEEKFKQNPKLAEKLEQTGKEEIREGNLWNDSFWGVTGTGGRNHFGKILMGVREKLRHESMSISIEGNQLKFV